MFYFSIPAQIFSTRIISDVFRHIWGWNIVKIFIILCSVDFVVWHFNFYFITIADFMISHVYVIFWNFIFKKLYFIISEWLNNILSLKILKAVISLLKFNIPKPNEIHKLLILLVLTYKIQWKLDFRTSQFAEISGFEQI